MRNWWGSPSVSLWSIVDGGDQQGVFPLVISQGRTRGKADDDRKLLFDIVLL